MLMLPNPKSKPETVRLILYTLLLVITPISLYLLNSKAAYSQDTYDYSVSTPLFEEVTSDTFSKSGGSLPTLTVGTGIDQIATIGKPVFKLFGWGPSETKIIVTGIGVSDATTSLKDGYFEFTSLYLPAPSYSQLENKYVFPEVCVQAVEKETTSQPTCIPAVAVDALSNSIGPVLVSPLLALDQATASLGDQVVARGRTAPNTIVTIHLSKKSYFESFAFVKTVDAAWLPEYEVAANNDGLFEFTLPTTDNASWNLFATARIQDSNTPKGTSLNFLVLSTFLAFILRIIAYIKSLQALLFPLLLLTQVLVIILLAKNIRRRQKKSKYNHERLFFRQV